MDLTQTDIEGLRAKGYNDQEIQQALIEVENEGLSNSYNNLKQTYDPRNNSRLSSFTTKQNEDIIRWQLELNDILERAEHILRGDVPTFKNGMVIWEKGENEKDNALNNFGVQETLKILSMYINRNTILSDYTNDEINEKVFDFGRETNNLFFMKSWEFGLNTEDKRKYYPIIIRELVDIVHSSYKRALNGGERISLRQMINVSQNTTNTPQMGGAPINPQQMKARSVLNPNRWLRGKYY